MNPLQNMKQAGAKLCCLVLATFTLNLAAGCRSRTPEEDKATHNLIQHTATIGSSTVYTICGLTISPKGETSLNPEVMVLSVVHSDGSGYIIRSHDDETLVTIKPSGFPKLTTRGKGFLLNEGGYQRGFYGTFDTKTHSLRQLSLAPLPREDDRQAMLALSAQLNNKCGTIVDQYKNGNQSSVYGPNDFDAYLKSLNETAVAMHTMARSRDKDPNGYRHSLGFEGQLMSFGVK